MGTWRNLYRDGVRLACRDFGGKGQSLLLLHGLAGHAEEWAQTASWLTLRCRVVAMDARGHGRSERRPRDVSRVAQVADASLIVERLELAPVVLVGQSLGGVTALSLAARRQELVRALVVVEASPAGDREEADVAARAMGEALRRWPVPFASRAAAFGFFEDRFGGPVAAEAWTRGLEERDNGWWPRFDPDVMERTLREAVARPMWDEWERIVCPTLVVRAANGVVEVDDARQMIERLPCATLVELADAAHDLHLDQPDEWRKTLSSFLDSLDAEF